MTDTPRTNEAAKYDPHCNLAHFARGLERELIEVYRKLESYSDDCAMMDSLRKRIEYLSIEVSFAIRKRDEWKNVSECLSAAVDDLLNHGSCYYDSNGDFCEHIADAENAKAVLKRFNQLK